MQAISCSLCYFSRDILYLYYLYPSDVGGRILPVWKNPLDPFQPDPEGLAYRPLDLGYPHAGPPPERGRSPTPTPVWETEDMLK